MMYGGTYIARPGHSTAPDMIIMIDDQLIPVVIMTIMNEKHKAHVTLVNCRGKSLLFIFIKVGILTHHSLNHPHRPRNLKDTFECFGAKYWQKIAASQGFAFVGRGHVEWVKYWQMPSPETSLFTTIPV